MKKRKLRLLVTAALMASVLAGCGSSAGISNQYAADTAAATTAPAGAQEEYLYDAGYGEYEAAEAAAEDNAAAETGSITQAEEVKEDPRAGRKLITTMNLSAETEYFDDLMGNLEKQITELGGYVESSNQWNGKTDVYGNRLENRNVYLVIRIPAEKLGSFVTMMEESSNITSKSQSVEDVTLAYVDLESHKKALLAEQERLLELMEMAETVEDLITVEDKLANVRYQLDSMESQLRTYDNKINYSTVNLDLQEVKRLTPVEEPTVWGRIRSGFSENMYAAGQDIENVLISIVISIPYILIWAVILAVLLLIVFLLAKREKKRKAKRLLKRQGLQKSAPAEAENADEEAENADEEAENADEKAENADKEAENANEKGKLSGAVYKAEEKDDSSK